MPLPVCFCVCKLIIHKNEHYIFPHIVSDYVVIGCIEEIISYGKRSFGSIKSALASSQRALYM